MSKRENLTDVIPFRVEFRSLCIDLLFSVSRVGYYNLFIILWPKMCHFLPPGEKVEIYDMCGIFSPRFIIVPYMVALHLLNCLLQDCTRDYTQIPYKLFLSLKLVL